MRVWNTARAAGMFSFVSLGAHRLCTCLPSPLSWSSGRSDWRHVGPVDPVGNNRVRGIAGADRGHGLVASHAHAGGAARAATPRQGFAAWPSFALRASTSCSAPCTHQRGNGRSRRAGHAHAYGGADRLVMHMPTAGRPPTSAAVRAVDGYVSLDNRPAGRRSARPLSQPGRHRLLHSLAPRIPLLAP